jgi:hypothetical protein
LLILKISFDTNPSLSKIIHIISNNPFSPTLGYSVGVKSSEASHLR